MSEKSSRQQTEEASAVTELLPVFQGKIISIYQETLHLQDGRTLIRDLVKHPGAVAVLPIDKEGNILFIKQWRRAAQKILIEIPAGTLEEGESPTTCAERELQEEIGFKAKTLTSLGGFYTAPGFCDEYIHLFVAQDLSPSVLWADDSDYIDLFPLSLEEAFALVSKKEFLDAKTLSALMLYQLWLKQPDTR